MFTRFMDMHSGGGCKEAPYEYIYIEAPKDEAKVIFYNRFGHNPERVTCTCCGDDYSIGEYVDLKQATAYDRNCRYAGEEKYIEDTSKRGYKTVDEYVKRPDVLVIYAQDIRPEEREGEVPEQGYYWKD